MKSGVIINSRFITQPLTGVQRFALEISREIKKNFPFVRFISPSGVHDESIAAELGVEFVGRLKGHAWEQIELPLILRSMGSPLLINLANSAPILYENKISTVHDAAVERFPYSFSFAFRTYYKTLIPLVLKGSRKICTVSQFSKSEISSIFNIGEDRIFVVGNAVSNSFFRIPLPAPSQPYILSVSSISKQKNFRRLIEAFVRIKDGSHSLYIVGDLNKSFSNSDLYPLIEGNARIKFLGRVSDSDLKNLYSQATAFIYPSLYEGFGIPPLEAQACGCPVIVSKAASIPEVCGDSAIYFNPYDVCDITTKIDYVIENEDLRKILVEKGLENVKRFDWKASALSFFSEVEDLL